MARYLILIKREQPAAGLFLAAGGAGKQHEEDAIEAFGGSCEQSLALLGSHDLAIVADFPSDEACYSFKLAATSTGNRIDAIRIVSDEQRDAARQLLVEVLDKTEPKETRP